jgi:hypothetical protein
MLRSSAGTLQGNALEGVSGAQRVGRPLPRTHYEDMAENDVEGNNIGYWRRLISWPRKRNFMLFVV